MAISFSGFNGIDFGALIDATITSESAPLNLLKQQQDDIKSKDAAFLSLSGGISTMETQASALIASSLFTSATATSSNTSVGSVTAGSDATSGEYSLHVDKLARGQVTASTTGYAAATDVVADGGSISFTIGGVTTDSINISSSTTLAGLRDAINAQKSDVIASIVNTGTNKKLVISSRSTGEDGAFTINDTLTNSGGPAIAFAVGQSPTSGNSQNAQDAEFTVNGVDFKTSSNTSTDVIPGIALKLTGIGDATVSVSPDYGNVETSLQSFVTTYNQLRQFSAIQNTANSTTGTRGPLSNDPVLRQAVDDLRNTIVSANNNGGKYKYLAEIGVSVDQTGMLQIDETALQEAINTNPEDVQKLLQGADSVKGVFGTMKDRLQNLDGTTGMIKSSRDTITASLRGVADRITATQLRLDVRKQELQKQFAAADQAISKLNSLSGQLSQLGTAKLF
jgi:flagellar hook-associated protein 2